MKSWLNRLFSASPPATRDAPRPATAVAPAGMPAVPAGPEAPTRPGEPRGHEMALLAWMANGPAYTVGPAGPREQAALSQLDRLVADTSAHHRLLPRAAAVIPPLLARLRSPALSLVDLSVHVSRDMTLVTEIIRMANGAHYRRDEAIVELDHALRVLGVAGLQSSIARAVLRPMIEVRSGKLLACSAARLWEHTDRKAQLCSALAPGLGFEALDACLAALAHNAVWSAVLRTMDEVDGDQPWRLSPAFVQALCARRNRLFAIVGRQWQLPDGILHAASDMNSATPPGEVAPATQLLQVGDRLAWLLCHPDRRQADAEAADWLRAFDSAVRTCYAGLDSSATEVVAA